ncbi:MAG: hypothetical protein CMJ59_21660 [Planctomycetaceae bacterium]|nr:hypothetical protein [Planctomycetaceae bacterium]
MSRIETTISFLDRFKTDRPSADDRVASIRDPQTSAPQGPPRIGHRAAGFAPPWYAFCTQETGVVIVCDRETGRVEFDPVLLRSYYHRGICHGNRFAAPQTGFGIARGADRPRRSWLVELGQ